MSIYETVYGQRSEAPAAPVAAALLARFLPAAAQGTPVEVLDIGGGNMALSRTMLSLAQARLPRPPEFRLHGWDVSETGTAAARAAGLDATVRDITHPLSPGDEGRYDVVLFLEVLEHVVETDAAVQNLHRLLKPGGLLILSTPNLAAWYNRVFLLLGRQPHLTEVSRYNVPFGNEFMEWIFGPHDGTQLGAGHLRVFTWRALKAFLRRYGFEILRARGVSNHRFDFISKVLCRFGPGLAGDICLAARKRNR